MSDFLGRTIEGEPSRDRGPHIVQHDPQLLLDALDKLLAVPGVEAVRWSMGTPSFNDGDPCTFSVHEALIRIVGDDDADSFEDEDGRFRSSYSLYDYEDGDWRKDRVFETINGFSGKGIYDALNEFERVLGSGHHDNILVEKFGDPSEVTATADGFEVGYYEIY